MSEYPLTIFYDGACGVCSKEMAYYMSIADQKVVFVNIAAPDFNALSYGKSNDDFQRELHVCDNQGTFYTGVEAFRKLWDTLPSPFYPMLSTFVGLPVIHFGARCGYTVFSKYRHLLPRKNRNICDLQ
jgi:predicted DCC family thiol-disulfide oxidoreductase YuxK